MLGCVYLFFFKGFFLRKLKFRNGEAIKLGTQSRRRIKLNFFFLLKIYFWKAFLNLEVAGWRWTGPRPMFLCICLQRRTRYVCEWNWGIFHLLPSMLIYIFTTSLILSIITRFLRINYSPNFILIFFLTDLVI